MFLINPAIIMTNVSYSSSHVSHCFLSFQSIPQDYHQLSTVSFIFTNSENSPSYPDHPVVWPLFYCLLLITAKRAASQSLQISTAQRHASQHNNLPAKEQPTLAGIVQRKYDRPDSTQYSILRLYGGRY